MQLEMFETPALGTYVAPAPKVPTALELLNLRPLLDRFAPLVTDVPLMESVWRWTHGDQRWSAVVNTWLLLAVHGYSADAAPLGDVLIGSLKLRKYVEAQVPPATASRITFAALREWAGPANWPDTCGGCGGDGRAFCTCGKFSECQNCSGTGLADCSICKGCKVAMAPREQRLEKTAVDSNLLACALETLAPAVAPGQNLWMWRDENAGRPAIRFESRDWRLIVMARTTEAKQ